jgi:hypothetical protein
MGDDKEQREELTEQGEILFRQVHPQFFTAGRISSQAFEAPRSHEGMLSVDRESLTAAKDSFALFTEGFGLSSACVCGVSVGEVNQHELHAYSDPVPATDDLPANPAHAIVDMSALGKKKMKKIAGRLAQIARARGILFQPA